MANKGMFFLVLGLLVIFSLSLTSAYDISNYTHRYKLENNFIDSNSTLNLTSTGSPLFNNTHFIEGQYALNSNNAGGGRNTGANGLSTGNVGRSMCTWVYPYNGAVESYIGGAGGTASTGIMFYTRISAGNLVSILGWGNDADISYTWQNRSWQRLCWTYNTNKTVIAYINGSIIGSTNLANNMNFGGNVLAVGISHTGSLYFNGLLDDFKFWDATLTPSEISAEFQTYTLPDASSLSVPNAYGKLNGTNIIFNSTFTTSGSLNITNCTFSLNNGSGTFINQTTQTFTNTTKSGVCLDNAIINTTSGTNISFKFYGSSFNSTNSYSTVSPLGWFISGKTVNGTVNYTKWVGNPLESNDTGQLNYSFAGGGSVSLYPDRDRLIGFMWRVNSSLGYSYNFFINSSTPYNITPTARINDLDHYVVPGYAYTRSGNHSINGTYYVFARLDNGSSVMWSRSSTNGVNWTVRCNGSVSMDGGGFPNFHTPTVYYEEFNATWHMLLQVQSSNDMNYYTSSNGCNWTAQGKVLEEGDGAWMIYTNGTWVVYNGRLDAGDWKVVWLKGPNLSSLTQQGSYILPAHQPWQTDHETDARIIVIPRLHQAYWDKKFYLYYVGSDFGYQGMAFDVDDRSFEEAHNVTLNIFADEVDLIPPSSRILYPQNLSYTTNVSQLNYTSDGFQCWYSKNEGITNSSITNCSINYSNVISIEGQNTWWLYSNDSLNNVNASSVTFYKITLPPTIVFDNPISSLVERSNPIRFFLTTDKSATCNISINNQSNITLATDNNLRHSLSIILDSGDKVAEAYCLDSSNGTGYNTLNFTVDIISYGAGGSSTSGSTAGSTSSSSNNNSYVPPTTIEEELDSGFGITGNIIGTNTEGKPSSLFWIILGIVLIGIFAFIIIAEVNKKHG